MIKSIPQKNYDLMYGNVTRTLKNYTFDQAIFKGLNQLRKTLAAHKSNDEFFSVAYLAGRDAFDNYFKSIKPNLNSSEIKEINTELDRQTTLLKQKDISLPKLQHILTQLEVKRNE